MGISVTLLIAQVVWSIFSKIFTSTFEINIYDDDSKKIKDRENVIVIANHIGAFDFMIINEISKKKKMMIYAKYMLKNSIKYVPFLGYMQFLGCPMLKRSFKEDSNTIKKWLSYFCTNNEPFWLIIYPEGTRINPKKKTQSDIFCDERGYQRLINVIYPRTKGFELSCNALKGSIKHIIDITSLYQEQNNFEAPTLFNFLFSMPKGKMNIHTKVFELDKIINYSEFVKERFYEKDKLLQEWKTQENK